MVVKKVGNLGSFKPGHTLQQNESRQLVLLSQLRLKSFQKVKLATDELFDIGMDKEQDAGNRVRALIGYVRLMLPNEKKSHEEIFSEALLQEAAKHFSLNDLLKIKDQVSSLAAEVITSE